MRESVLFDHNWLFHKGDINVEFPTVKGPTYIMAKTQRMKMGPVAIAYNDNPDDFRMDDKAEIESARWVRVTLPHDYMIASEFREENNNALGYVKYENAWYRKHFTIPAEDEGRRITLLFDGVATHATVYLNGCLMKHNFCGYTSFEVDITDVVKYGADNVLAVYVKTTEGHEGWWYEGGGIYRHVHLTKTSPVCVDLWGVYAAPKKFGGAWRVDFETTILNETYENKRVSVTTRVVGADGISVGEASAEGDVELKGKGVFKYSAPVTDPRLWDIDSPNLYTVVTDVYADGELCDTYTTRCGFREVVMDPDEGLFLNGRHVKINGVCAHQGFGITGKAVPDNILRYQVKLMKEMGANGFRCSHYPHPEATMDALDEMGFLVMDETRWFESTDEGKAQLEMVMKRDRNRPSVIFWSVGNEEPHHATPEGRRIAKTLMALAHKLDDTRCIMTAVDHPERCTVYDELEAVGVNYNTQNYEQFHNAYPDKPFFSSECSATGTTRGWYLDDSPIRGRASAYDHDSNAYFVSREKTYKLMDKKWCMGSYQWAAIEHRGECIWPRLCSLSGAIDLFLQKKDAFYQNQSFWLETPMVHLLPHWNWRGFEGEDIKIFVYSNCDEVALILNGNELGRQKVEKYTHLEWTVQYEAGKLEAVGYRDGKEVCRDVRETSGAPCRLRLKLDNDMPSASGRDMAIVTCWVEDENGRPVPDASPFVHFDACGTGRICGTGSDNADHNPVSLPDRQMYAGLVTAAVAIHGAGKAKIIATADGLLPAVLKLDIE